VELLRYPKSLNGMNAALSWYDGLPTGINKWRSKFYTFVTVPAAL